jgi:hypothetical protein
MDTVRITISGGDLRTPVEITDSATTDMFRVWAGPGNFRREPDGSTAPVEFDHGFIVDWSRGSVPPPDGNATTYTVDFTTSRSDRNVYRVRYRIDAATGDGYVYLPGKGEEGYADNTWMILRGVEGKWFHAWGQWEQVSLPLIAAARTH